MWKTHMAIHGCYGYVMLFIFAHAVFSGAEELDSKTDFAIGSFSFSKDRHLYTRLLVAPRNKMSVFPRGNTLIFLREEVDNGALRNQVFFMRDGSVYLHKTPTGRIEVGYSSPDGILSLRDLNGDGSWDEKFHVYLNEKRAELFIFMDNKWRERKTDENGHYIRKGRRKHYVWFTGHKWAKGKKKDKLSATTSDIKSLNRIAEPKERKQKVALEKHVRVTYLSVEGGKKLMIESKKGKPLFSYYIMNNKDYVRSAYLNGIKRIWVIRKGKNIGIKYYPLNGKWCFEDLNSDGVWDIRSDPIKKSVFINLAGEWRRRYRDKRGSYVLEKSLKANVEFIKNKWVATEALK